MFVRWDNLKVETEASHTLPGYREPAAVRTFDAPEALDVRFYEVQAKSVLNKVPKASRMPFRWTINPYRGCAHACHYCFARPTHTYLDFNAGRDFEREIVVKVNTPELARALQDAKPTVYHAASFAGDDPAPEAQAFVKAFEAHHKRKPGGIAALSYDAAMLVFQAYARTHVSSTPRKISPRCPSLVQRHW